MTCGLYPAVLKSRCGANRSSNTKYKSFYCKRTHIISRFPTLSLWDPALTMYTNNYNLLQLGYTKDHYHDSHEIVTRKLQFWTLFRSLKRSSKTINKHLFSQYFHQRRGAVVRENYAQNGILNITCSFRLMQQRAFDVSAFALWTNLNLV